MSKTNKKVTSSEEGIKIHFLDDEREFKVNESKKIVTCILRGKITLPDISHRDDILYKNVFNLPYYCIKGVGVAKCLEEDTFDIELGKKIAAAKAETNAYRNALRLCNIEKDKMQYKIDLINKFFKKTMNISIHNKEYIEKIGK